MAFIIVIFVLIVLVIFVWVVYNKLIRQKNLISEAWGALDITLKKRHDLVPNLIAVVQGISEHEKALFTEVTKWRAQAMSANGTADLQNAENMLSAALGKINVVMENYPDLVSGKNYLKLQDQLFEIEDEISYSRRYYNGTIRNNNILIESFPSNIFANLFKFEKPPYFEIELSSEKNVPLVNFNEDEA